MILRQILRYKCWGVWGHRHTHTSTPSHGSLPIHHKCWKNYGVEGGATKCLPTSMSVASVHTASQEWWRKRRRRRWWGGEVLLESPYSPQHPHCLLYSSTPFLEIPLTSGGQESQVKDDEAAHLEEEEVEGGGVEEGEFFDTPYHHHYKIQLKDIGMKVTVGEPVIAELSRLFQIKRGSALKMVRSKKFMLVSDSAILKTLYFLKDHNITSAQLQRIPWILLHPADSLQLKFAKLSEPHLFLQLSDGLGFCHFSMRQITKYQRVFTLEANRFPAHHNRVYYLAEKLQVPVEQLVEKVVKPKQILTMDMKRIEDLIELFHEYGVQMEDVMSDLWVFCHNITVTEERLRKAVEVGCQRPKPWICHAAAPVFEKYIERCRSRTQLLGLEGNLKEFLCERLECCPKVVALNLQRNPSLTRINVTSLNNKLDLLYGEGFTPADVRSCMRVLQNSEKRTRQRIEELKSLGYHPFPIRVLYKSPKTYKNLVAKIKRGQLEKEDGLGTSEEPSGGGVQGLGVGGSMGREDR